jgi:FtsP/CotA-like multicopper oxidase with cupredoxin domain
MSKPQTLDARVQITLRGWPQSPPGLVGALRGAKAWMRGRPTDVNGLYSPFLKLPGSYRLRTLPDGLWLCFGGSSVEIFVDIFGIM